MIKLFTHTDLDGVGCSYLAKTAFGDDVSVEYCGYNNVNEVIEDFINTKNVDNYRKIYITDISVNEKIASQIDMFKDKFVLIDHHPTALWLNKYDWASVITHDKKDKKICGTMLFYEYLVENKLITTHLYMHDIVNYINFYDTWRWVEDFEEPYILPKKLDNLLKLIGRDEFLEFILGKNAINSYDKVLDIEEKKIKNLIQKKSKDIRSQTIVDANGNGRKFVWNYCEEYVSEVGNGLCSIFEDVADFVVLIDMSRKSVSFRSLAKKDINTGLDIAKMFGGGGHKDSSGCPLVSCWVDLVKNDIDN